MNYGFKFGFLHSTGFISVREYAQLKGISYGALRERVFRGFRIPGLVITATGQQRVRLVDSDIEIGDKS